MNQIKLFFADVESELKGTPGIQNLQNDTGTAVDIVAILNWVYAIAGVVAVGFIVFGAVKYVTAQGEPGKIREASQTLAFTVVGLIIIMLATVITNFVFTSIEGA